jgi:hypothetical protein
MAMLIGFAMIGIGAGGLIVSKTKVVNRKPEEKE